jgi:hypothetical protein
LGGVASIISGDRVILTAGRRSRVRHAGRIHESVPDRHLQQAHSRQAGSRYRVPVPNSGRYDCARLTVYAVVFKAFRKSRPPGLVEPRAVTATLRLVQAVHDSS